MKLENGRPTSPVGRNEKEWTVYELLGLLGIPFDRVDHPAASTIEALAEVDKILGTRMCKNLFLTNSNHSAYYLLLMPGDKPFKTKELSPQIGSSRLSFASPEDMEKYLHLSPGAVTVLSLAFDTENQVHLVIDRDLLKEEYIGCHPMVNTASLRIRTADILEKFLPETGHKPILVDLKGVV